MHFSISIYLRYSFIAFGEWPARATYTPLFKKVKLVIANDHEDMWVVWLEKMELQVRQNTYVIQVSQNMILDTGKRYTSLK